MTLVLLLLLILHQLILRLILTLVMNTTRPKSSICTTRCIPGTPLAAILFHLLTQFINKLTLMRIWKVYIIMSISPGKFLSWSRYWHKNHQPDQSPLLTLEQAMHLLRQSKAIYLQIFIFYTVSRWAHLFVLAPRVTIRMKPKNYWSLRSIQPHASFPVFIIVQSWLAFIWHCRAQTNLWILFSC